MKASENKNVEIIIHKTDALPFTTPIYQHIDNTYGKLTITEDKYFNFLAQNKSKIIKIAVIGHVKSGKTTFIKNFENFIGGKSENEETNKIHDLETDYEKGRKMTLHYKPTIYCLTNIFCIFDTSSHADFSVETEAIANFSDINIVITNKIIPLPTYRRPIIVILNYTEGHEDFENAINYYQQAKANLYICSLENHFIMKIESRENQTFLKKIMNLKSQKNKKKLEKNHNREIFFKDIIFLKENSRYGNVENNYFTKEIPTIDNYFSSDKNEKIFILRYYGLFGKIIPMVVFEKDLSNNILTVAGKKYEIIEIFTVFKLKIIKTDKIFGGIPYLIITEPELELPVKIAMNRDFNQLAILISRQTKINLLFPSVTILNKCIFGSGELILDAVVHGLSRNKGCLQNFEKEEIFVKGVFCRFRENGENKTFKDKFLSVDYKNTSNGMINKNYKHLQNTHNVKNNVFIVNYKGNTLFLDYHLKKYKYIFLEGFKILIDNGVRWGFELCESQFNISIVSDEILYSLKEALVSEYKKIQFIGYFVKFCKSGLKNMKLLQPVFKVTLFTTKSVQFDDQKIIFKSKVNDILEIKILIPGLDIFGFETECKLSGSIIKKKEFSHYEEVGNCYEVMKKITEIRVSNG
ncbi:GTP-binding protein TypA/BipA like protein [Dictyocoela muelleri]|nr:GTP-binding protein TypA/BipA like protein [Dictyocoela muelleri]